MLWKIQVEPERLVQVTAAGPQLPVTLWGVRTDFRSKHLHSLVGGRRRYVVQHGLRGSAARLWQLLPGRVDRTDMLLFP
jgi:hypothetical protein